ncbi:AIG2-like family-domain-containing protein, partial [Elsinoe ampelina]
KTLFFYGTLTFPPILHRVIHGPSNPTFPTPSSSYVRTYPALLPSHRRHRVRGADYPAVVPSTASASVRGTLAAGLTDADVRRLDIFEGGEYERRKVGVRRLIVVDAEEMEEGEEVEAETYIWIAGENRLEDEEWDFETFKREKMRFWIGRDGTEGE